MLSPVPYISDCPSAHPSLARVIGGKGVGWHDNHRQCGDFLPPTPFLLCWGNFTKFCIHTSSCCCFSYFVNVSFSLGSFTFHGELISFYVARVFSFPVHNISFPFICKKPELSSESLPIFKRAHKRLRTVCGLTGFTPR